MEIEKGISLKKEALNKKVSLCISKSKVFITNQKIDIKKDFIKINEFLVNKKNIELIQKRKDNYRIVITYQSTITGVIIKFDGSFIIISINDSLNNVNYDYVIPIKSVLGIKIHDQKEDEEIKEEEIKIKVGDHFEDHNIKFKITKIDEENDLIEKEIIGNLLFDYGFTNFEFEKSLKKTKELLDKKEIWRI